MPDQQVISAPTSPLNGNASAAQSDVKTLLKDAQELFQAAATLSGEKADEMRARAMKVLDAALGKAQQAQSQAIVKGKELAQSADVYVKENPWRTIATAAGLALLVGVILGRR
ncbi:MAG: DUF883 family protein [Pseudomonadota bacterium]